MSAQSRGRITSSAPSDLGGNILLETLGRAAIAEIGPHATRVSLKRGAVLSTPARPLRRLYFPTTSVLSLATSLGRRRVHVMAIGSESVVGYWLGLSSASELDVVVTCEVGGESFALPVRHLHDAEVARPRIGGLMAEVALSTTAQLIRNVACATSHSLPARCARQLLELNMRLGEAFEITHNSLAMLLTVGRPSITRVMHALAEDGVIEYVRGKVLVRDPERLRRRSCGCEAVLAARRDWLLGQRTGWAERD